MGNKEIWLRAGDRAPDLKPESVLKIYTYAFRRLRGHGHLGDHMNVRIVEGLCMVALACQLHPFAAKYWICCFLTFFKLIFKF